MIILHLYKCMIIFWHYIAMCTGVRHFSEPHIVSKSVLYPQYSAKIVLYTLSVLFWGDPVSSTLNYSVTTKSLHSHWARGERPTTSWRTEVFWTHIEPPWHTRGTRPAHILGGWMRYTPRFPKDPWEILKIHEISLIFHENSSKSMKNHGFSWFPKDPWEIWVCISSTPPSCVHAYAGRRLQCFQCSL